MRSTRARALLVATALLALALGAACGRYGPPVRHRPQPSAPAAAAAQPSAAPATAPQPGAGSAPAPADDRDPAGDPDARDEEEQP